MADKTKGKISLYALNKNMISQLSPLKLKEIDTGKSQIQDFLNISNNSYYLCLFAELKYYTVFKIEEGQTEKLVDILVNECLPSLGKIKSIHMTEKNDAVEIWVTEPNGNSAVGYLFGYDKGVVSCQK